MPRTPRVPAEFAPFLEAFRGESDRAAAVLAGAYIDTQLEQLFRARLLEDAPTNMFSQRGSLGDFASKIDLAYALGWISSDLKHDIHIVRSIRNSFAHDVNHTLSFESDTVADRTRNFQAHKIIGELIAKSLLNKGSAEGLLAKAIDEIFRSARQRFGVAFVYSQLLLARRIDESTRPVEIRDAVALTIPQAPTTT